MHLDEIIGFHGTASRFNAFRLEKPNGHPSKVGIWFTDNREVANDFARRTQRAIDDEPAVIEAELRLDNPKQYETYRDFLNDCGMAGGSEKLRRRLMRRGHDGIVIEKSDTDVGIVRRDFVVFSPKQIRIMTRSRLGEAIQLPPRNTKLYTTGLIKKLKAIETAFPRIAEVLKAIDASDSMFAYDARRGFDRLDSLSNLSYSPCSSIEYIVKQRNNTLRLEDMVHNLESMLQYGHDFLKYYMNTLEYFKEHYDRNIKPCIETLQHIDELYAWMDERGDLEDEEAGDLPQRYFDAMRSLKWCLETLVSLVRDSEAKFGEVQRMMTYNYRPEEFRPIHGEVETLYHATAYVKEILQNGFQAERPQDYQGVGNIGDQKGISFSYDLHICKEIARCLKEFGMIGRGELQPRHILAWGKREGIDMDKCDVMKMHRMQPNRPWSIGDAAELYSYYLWMNKIRSNPVFTSPNRVAVKMANRDPKDIGVLACEVDLTNYHSFHHGEKEFRVPPQAVKSVKRVW